MHTMWRVETMQDVSERIYWQDVWERSCIQVTRYHGSRNEWYEAFTISVPQVKTNISKTLDYSPENKNRDTPVNFRSHELCMKCWEKRSNEVIRDLHKSQGNIEKNELGHIGSEYKEKLFANEYRGKKLN